MGVIIGTVVDLFPVQKLYLANNISAILLSELPILCNVLKCREFKFLSCRKLIMESLSNLTFFKKLLDIIGE
jgi:hypothetical protein